LISYADFITLLFAFFVVMYSISQVNDSKYRVLSETFIDAFNRPVDAQTSKDPGDEASLSRTQIAPIEMDNAARDKSQLEEQVPLIVDSEPALDRGDDAVDETRSLITTSDELTQISDLVSEKFSALIGERLIQVTSNELWLQIELKDSIIFSSGSAD